MRKFSKKIAMMMVLAMLVSMFSGIVSASAASIWSAKSVDDDNYAVVMGETIEVKKGEFINFDLFKADEEATEAGYEYTWESSDADVLFINGAKGAKNGYARVKGEVGEEATITATFTNLTTGKSAKRSFDVVVVEELTADVEEAEYLIDVNFGDEPFLVGDEYELKATVTDLDEKAVEAKVVFSVDGKAIEGKYVPAEAGDVVIVATVTIDEEEFEAEYACTVVNANIFDVEQASMNSFKMYFDELKDVSKIAKGDITVSLAAKEGALKTKQFVKEIKADKDNNVVTVTLYNNFAKDNVITAEYKGESAAFQAVKGNVAEIKLTDAKVKFGEKTALPIKIYDEFGVDITSPELLAKVTVDKKTGSENAVISGLDITMWAKDKVTTVQATYHTYTYTNGVENTFKSEIATITSVADVDTYSPISNWAITKEPNKDKIVWDASNMLALNDSEFKLVGKLTKTTTAVNSKTDVITTLAGGFTFESSDSTVVIVLADGTLIPVSKGAADILVKKGNDVLGVYTVSVVDARKATSMEITVEGSTVISYQDQVVVKLAVKDQYGVAMNAAKDSIAVKDVKTNGDAACDKADNKITFKGDVQGAAADTTTYYRFIKVGDATAYFEYTVKKLDGAAVSYKFDQVAQTVDTSLAGNADKTFNEVFAPKTIKVLGYDKNGMLASKNSEVKEIDPSVIGTAVTGNVVEGAFYVTVTKPQNAKNFTVTAGADGIKFEYMTVGADNMVSKATAGNYVFNLYKGVKAGDNYYYEFVATSTITVKDAQKSYDVTVKSVNSNAAAAEVKAISGTAFQAAIGDVFTIKNPNANNAEVAATRFTADAAKAADYVVGNANTVVIKKANIVSEFAYKGVTYKLAETVTFPIVSVTCK